MAPRAILTACALTVACASAQSWLDGDGVPLHWNRAELPLTVTADPEWYAVTQGAVEEWNRATGLAAFRMGRPGAHGAVHISADTSTDDRDGWTDLYYARDGRLLRAAIALPPELPPWGYSMAIHELGHALGLAHGEAIMRATLSGDVCPPIGPRARRALRDAYGN